LVHAVPARTLVLAASWASVAAASLAALSIGHGAHSLDLSFFPLIVGLVAVLAGTRQALLMVVVCAAIVKKDPNTAGTEADVQAQTKLMLQIRDNMNMVTDLINQAELVRAQLAHQQQLAGDDESGKAAKARAAELDRTIVAVESKLFNMTATGRGQDQLRLPSQIAEKVSHLADVVSLNDFAPTDQALAVHQKLSQELSDYREQLRPMLAAAQK
jgi:hypothetical protein